MHEGMRQVGETPRSGDGDTGGDGDPGGGRRRAADGCSPADERVRAYARLRPLVAAEAAAEAAGTGAEAADLEQAVWLRLVESGGPPDAVGSWVPAAVRAAARAAGEGGAGTYQGAAGGERGGVEETVVDAEHERALWAAVRGLPGRCPRIVMALMSRSDRTYREISRELGISQGSLGPLRSRCLRCLRTILNSRVGAPVGRGNAR